MFGLLTASDELVPVHKDPTVQAANERLSAARRELDALEIEERRMIAVVMGREDVYTDEELDAARRTLRTRIGTQTNLYWPQADTARDALKQAEAAYHAAADPAKARLTEAATAKIAALTKQLDAAVQPARHLAIEIEQARQQMSDGGARPLEHPCAALLPDGMVDFQLRIARLRGWI